MIRRFIRLLRFWPTAILTAALAWILWATIDRLGAIGPYRFERPRAVYLLLFAPSLYAVAWHSLAGVPGWQRIVMGTTRCLLLGIATIVLALPRVRVESTGRCTVLLVDVSQSVPDEALEAGEQWARSFTSKGESQDTQRRVAFDATPRLVERSFADARAKGPEAASDYGRAIRFAAGLCGAHQQRQLVLFGDGLDTHGGMAASAERVRRLGFTIDVVPSRVPPPADVAVRRVTPPSEIEVGRPFRVGIDLHATRPCQAELRFELDGLPNPREKSRSISVAAGDSHVEFESVASRAGKTTIRVTADMKGPDVIGENNSARAAVEVQGPPRILYVEGKRERASTFESALSAQRFAVEVIAPSEFPRSLAGLLDKAFVVLSDLRRDQLGSYADQVLEQYVREHGGGLLFAGGPSSQAGGGWSGSTLERMLPVVLSAPQQQEGAEVALVLVIDRSGSMSGLPLEMAKAACAATVETLRTGDWIEVIAFDAKPIRYVAMQRARARAAIANDLSRILSGGDTELFPALDMAYEDLLAVEARRKHVILLTDGQSPKAGLAEIVQNMVAEAMTLTIVGLGNDVDTELLRYLAGRGGGRYHAAPTPDALPRIFTREAESLTKVPDNQEWFDVHVRQRAEFLRGIALDALPKLHGYVRARAKAGSSEVILESGRAEPILARSRHGAGWVLAWTSDLRSHWAAEWVRWQQYGQFFAQMFRQHQGQRSERAIPMRVEQKGDRVTVEVDAVNADGTFDNDRAILLEVIGSDANGTVYRELLLRAPGLYQAEFRLPRFGDYFLKARHRRYDERGHEVAIGESRAQVSLSYPVEFERLAPDLVALERLAQLSGGRFEPTPDTVNRSPREAIVSDRPWHVPWLLAMLGVFVIDLFFRRMRWRHRGPAGCSSIELAERVEAWPKITRCARLRHFD